MGDFSRNLPNVPYIQQRRPAKSTTTALPPPIAAEETDKDLVTITGGGGQLITLNHSASSSQSRSVVKETKLIYDVVRIYRIDENNNVDDTQWIDVERPKRLEVTPPGNALGPTQITYYNIPPPRRNEVILETRERITSGG